MLLQACHKNVTQGQNNVRYLEGRKPWQRSSKQTRTSCCMHPQWEEGTTTLTLWELSVCVCVCVRVCFRKIDYDLHKVLYISLTEHLNLPKSEGGADEVRYQTSDSFITHTDRTQEENILTY